ncbi:hypothetical protein RDI58_018618 [Solanum bulbocastanum]|uniref:Uncharacterized protein n=1 Tax=Solanum bulbocastanum TaxID=147425 RepID=A0AAN8TAY8_SOLBU
MEVLDISLYENESNKENIAPSSAEKLSTNCLKVKCCTKKFKRNFKRAPLRDITHLFDSPVQPGSTVFKRFHQSVYGKRKMVDEDVDLLQKNKSKILRRDFR